MEAGAALVGAAVAGAAVAGAAVAGAAVAGGTVGGGTVGGGTVGGGTVGGGTVADAGSVGAAVEAGPDLAADWCVDVPLARADALGEPCGVGWTGGIFGTATVLAAEVGGADVLTVPDSMWALEEAPALGSRPDVLVR